MTSHCGENGVGGVAHTRLDREERLRDAAGLHLGGKEVGNILSDPGGGIVALAERAGFVGQIGFDDTGDLGRIDLDAGGANTVVDFVNRDFPAMWRISRLIDVMETAEGGWVITVEFDNDMVRCVAESLRCAHGSGEHDLAVISHVTGFNHCPLPSKPVTHRLRQGREMHVEEFSLSGIDALAQFRAGLVGGAEGDCVRGSKRAIQRCACGSASKNANLEGFPFGVEFGCALGKCFWNGLGTAGRSESAETYIVAIADEGRGFCRGKTWYFVVHKRLNNGAGCGLAKSMKRHWRLGLFLCDFRKDLSFFDAGSDFGKNALHCSGLRRGDVGVHLHRFQGDDLITFLDFLADADGEGYHLARKRTDDGSRSGSCSSRFALGRGRGGENGDDNGGGGESHPELRLDVILERLGPRR